MKEVTIKLPTIGELDREGINDMQDKVIDKETSEKLAKEGMAIYVTTNSMSFAPDGKTAVFSLYVVLGSEEDIKNSLKYYYPQGAM
jgi:hypothetical protein